MFYNASKSSNSASKAKLFDRDQQRFHIVLSHLSSLHRRMRLWEPADVTAAAGTLTGRLDSSRRFRGFSGVSLRRSCCSSCSYICLWRSRAQRFSSSCCLSRVCNTTCKGSEEKGEPEGKWEEPRDNYQMKITSCAKQQGLAFYIQV